MELVELSNKPNRYYLPIHLSNGNYDAEIAEAIAIIRKAVSEGKQIERVDFYGISFNEIAKTQLQPLFEVIKEARVASLDLVSINLNHTEASKIQDIFSLVADACRNGAVKKVELGRNFLGDASPIQQDAIVQGLLAIVPYIQELDLSSNRLEGLGIGRLQNLFIGLARSENLTSLYLRENSLLPSVCAVDVGAQALELLNLLLVGRRQKWELLSLSSFTDVIMFKKEQWQCFLDKASSACSKIDLSYNDLQEFTNEGQDSVFLDIKDLKDDLADVLARTISSGTILELNLSHNGFSVTNTKKLREAAIGRQIKLNLEGNDCPDNERYYQYLAELTEASRISPEAVEPPDSSEEHLLEGSTLLLYGFSQSHHDFPVVMEVGIAVLPVDEAASKSKCYTQ